MLAMLVTALLFATATGPQETPSAGVSQLLLRLEADKRTFVLYERVGFTYRVENPTSGTITSNVEPAE